MESSQRLATETQLLQADDCRLLESDCVDKPCCPVLLLDGDCIASMLSHADHWTLGRSLYVCHAWAEAAERDELWADAITGTP